MHDNKKEITSSIDIFLKDLTIVLKSADALNMELPLSEAALKQYIISYESGKGNEDDSAVYKNYNYS